LSIVNLLAGVSACLRGPEQTEQDDRRWTTDDDDAEWNRPSPVVHRQRFVAGRQREKNYARQRSNNVMRNGSFSPTAAAKKPRAMNDHAFVFVVGLHRSGKSLLGRFLGEHPEVSSFFNPDHEGAEGHDEGQHAQSVYRPASAFGGPGAFGHHPEAWRDETHPLATAETGARLFDAWRSCWDERCPFLLETSPLNLARTRFLQAIFPETYFLCVLRHPVAVSYETAEWNGLRIDHLLDHWLTCHERFENDCRHLENVLSIKYERFVKAPQSCFDEVCSFLGVERQPAAHEIKAEANVEYFRKWEKQPINRYDSAPLHKVVRTYCRLRFERRTNAFGYSLEDLEQVETHSPRSRLAA
jgi:hypothetical protein